MLIIINNGGVFNVSGMFDVVNSNNFIFIFVSGGLLVIGNFVMFSCCNVVMLNGMMNIGNFFFMGFKLLMIGGMVMVNGDFDVGINSSIIFIGGWFEVVGMIIVGGSV